VSGYVSVSWLRECLVLRRQDTEVLRLNSVSPVWGRGRGLAWRAMDGCCALEVAVVVLGGGHDVLGLGRQVAVGVCMCVCMNNLGVAVTEGQLACSCMAVLDSPCLACTRQRTPEKQPLISAPAGHRYPCSIPLVYGSTQLRAVMMVMGVLE
jgi:hypothetical protein